MIFRLTSRKLRRVVGFFLALVVLGAGMAILPADQLAGAEANQQGTIPNFWDPKRRVERPPAGAVLAIRFVTTDDFPPFNFLDANGHLAGFNVDLARAICAE